MTTPSPPLVPNTTPHHRPSPSITNDPPITNPQHPSPPIILHHHLSLTITNNIISPSLLSPPITTSSYIILSPSLTSILSHHQPSPLSRRIVVARQSIPIKIHVGLGDRRFGSPGVQFSATPLYIYLSPLTPGSRSVSQYFKTRGIKPSLLITSITTHQNLSIPITSYYFPSPFSTPITINHPNITVLSPSLHITIYHTAKRWIQVLLKKCIWEFFLVYI